MMADEKSAIAWILAVLRDQGDTWFRKRSGVGIDIFNNHLSRTFKSVSKHSVGLINHNKQGEFESDELIVLAPPEADQDMFLGLWARWDFEKPNSDCGFFLGIWKDLNDKKSMTGYRFESPHIYDDDDPETRQHDFYHAQPCLNLGKRKQPAHFALPITENLPTFALAATNNTELVLHIVLSMHGKIGLKDLEGRFKDDPNSRSNPILRDAFAKLRSLPG